MNQNERKTVMRRMVLLIAVAALVMGLYALRLIFLQLVNGDEYKSQATNTTDYNFTVTAARGDIVDSTGKRIATTTSGNTYISHPLYCAYRVSKLLKARFCLFRFARLLGGFDFVINCARKSP